VTTHLDVTERQLAEDKLAYLAGHDALTGLANRALVIDTLERRLQQPGCFALIFVDLDRFKPVNDECGHACGDELLRQVADRLRRCVRETDTIARFGGDEFIVVQAQIGRPEDASIMAARIVDTIAAPFRLENNRVRISASVGIAIAPQDGRTADSLLKHADLALYGSKQAGRGTFSRFEQDMLGRRRLQLASS
jgi:diguanylate cyclase (GGDEF)-like protein